MNIHDKLIGQITSGSAPLFAVGVSALPIPNTPVLLCLYWHGFEKNENPAPRQSDVPTSMPATFLQINEHWDTIESVDAALLDTAWLLGAWDLNREEWRSCNIPGATPGEIYACQKAFASTATIPEESMLIEAPDLPDMLSLAARFGYIRYQFRPVQGGVWRDVGEDTTLNQEGGRNGPCPVKPARLVGQKIRTTRYRFGQQSSIFLR